MTRGRKHFFDRDSDVALTDYGQAEVATALSSAQLADAPISNSSAFHISTAMAADTTADRAGNESVASSPVAIDTVAPAPLSIATSPAITIADGATVEIAGASAQAITFTGTSGTLKLDDALHFTGRVSGLAGADALALADLKYNADTTATFLGNTTGGTLTISNGTQTASIALQGDYLSSYWTVSSDGNGGTVVVDPAASNNWQPLKIGAGGWLTGINIAPDDTMVVRTDTYGAYVWNGTQWQQLITSTSMPSAFVTQNSSYGVYEIQIAPSNSNIMYMMYEGYVLQSTNKGTTWTQTSFAPVSGADANDPNYKLDGQKMAIDPNNPNIVYVGTPNNGLFVTTNGGASWQSVSAVPLSLPDSSGDNPGFSGILFDPALGVTGGKTNTIFAASYGHGVYESTNGGASWSAIGGPSNVQYAAVSSTGVYYAVNNQDTPNSSLWSYQNGQWTQLLQSDANGIATVAVNPFNPNEIVAQNVYGQLNVSYNGGTTWSGINFGNQLVSTDIPWLAHASDVGNGWVALSVGGTVFDQLTPNKLWVSDGTGVWNTTSLPTASLPSNTPIVWNDQSIGIEQLVANQILVPPGGKPILASWDRPFFYVSDPSTYSSTYSPNLGGKMVEGWSLDYASSNPNFIVGLADNGGGPTYEYSGYSTNGGQSWTVFPSFPTGAGTNFIGGTIAASTPTNIIWAPSGGVDPFYTLDGGISWHPITLPGISSWSGFDTAYYFDTRSVTADRVLANTFYLYYPDQGVFRTTDGGATWAKVFSGAISQFSYYNSELQSVPGQAGNLFFTGGPLSGPQPINEGFYRSTNGGTTWTAVPNVLEVNCFGFGAPAPGQSYPSIYIVGWVNNVYGVWQSNNNAQSWVQIGTYPLNSLDQIKTISGDPNTYGQVYVGFQGSGYAYLPAAAASAGPTVSSVMETPASGDFNAGHTVSLTLTFSAAVTVAGGTPTLTLNDGGTATYTGGSGTNTLTFSHTVAAGQNTASLAATAVNLNGATMQDGSGNAANLLLTGLTQSGPQIDTTAPSAPTIASFSTDSGTVGDHITNDNTLTLTGTAEANATVKVFDGATLLGSAVANGSGAWSYTTAALANGCAQPHRHGHRCRRQCRCGFGRVERHRRHRGAGCARHRLVLARQRHGGRRHHQRQYADPDRNGGSQRNSQGF